MKIVGKAVYHRNLGRFRQILHPLLGEGSDNNAINIPGEDGPHILKSLAPGKLESLGLKKKRVCSKMRKTDLKRNSRPGRGLLKDESDGVISWKVMRLPYVPKPFKFQ